MPARKLEYIPLNDANQIVAEIFGEIPHTSTLHRWASIGIAGVRLKTIFVCGARRTTRAWLQEFFSNVTESKNGEKRRVKPRLVKKKKKLKLKQRQR